MIYIKKLELTAFGKFENYTLELHDGVNEFVFPNEFGKSTITDFLLFMLYGFQKTLSKKILLEDNLLKKYMPWSNVGYISGALTVVSDGVQYRIERRQRESASRSNTVVRNVSGQEIMLDCEPGEYFFGVDRDTFERTFLIRQTDIRFFGTGGIETALKNLVTTGDEGISFESAMEVLKKKKSKFQHGERRSGRIFEIPKQIAMLERQLFDKNKKLNELQGVSHQLDEIRHEITKLSATQNRLSSLLPIARGNIAKKMLEKLRFVQNEIITLKQKLDGVKLDITDKQFDSASEIFANAAACKTRLEKATADLKELEQKLAILKEDITDFDYIKQNKNEIYLKLNDKGSVNYIFIILGAIELVLGVLLYVFVSPAFLSFTGVGILFFALAFLLRKKPVLEPDIVRQYHLYVERASEIDVLTALVKKAILELETAKAEAFKNENDIKNIKQTMGVDSAQALSNLRALCNEGGLVRARILELEQTEKELLQYGSVTMLESQAQNSGELDVTLAQLENKLAQTVAEKNELTARAVSLEREAGDAAILEKEIFEIEAQISDLNTELEKAQYQNKVLDMAISALGSAYDRINSEYSPRLTEKARGILSLLTDGKYDSVYLDKQFNIRIKADGELKELGYFSRGTQDAVYFAVRRAVSELISDKNGLPVIMDDPFWSLDDKRLQNAKEYMQKIFSNSQAIIFSARQ